MVSYSFSSTIFAHPMYSRLSDLWIICIVYYSLFNPVRVTTIENSIPDPDQLLFVQIWFLSSTSKKFKKNFDFYSIVSSLLTSKTDINVPKLSNTKKV
jgi:hypothetical protein